MANIPLPRTPDVQSATGYSQVDPSTGAAAIRSLTGLGQSIAQFGGAIKGMQEEKQRLDGDAAESALDLEFVKAKGEIDEYAARNQNNPASIRSYADKRISNVLDNEEYQRFSKNIGDERQQELIRKYRLESEKLNVSTNNQVTQIEIKNSNAAIMQQAQMKVDLGDVKGAISAINKANIPDEERIDWIENSLRKKQYSDVEYRLDSLTTPAEYDEFIDEIMKKDKATGRYTSYTTTLDLAEEGSSEKQLLELAGVDEPQRKYFRTLASKRKNALVKQQERNYSRILQDASKGNPEAIQQLEQRMLEDGEDGIPEEYRETAMKQVEQAIESYTTEQDEKAFMKSLESDEEYKKLSSEITKMLLNPSRDVGFGSDPQDRYDQFKSVGEEISSSALDVRGKAKLMSMLLDARSNDYTQNDETYKDGILFQRDRPIQKSERVVLNAMFEGFQKQIELAGYDAELHEQVAEADHQINEFFTDIENPTYEQIQELKAKILTPIERRILWQSKHGK